MDRSIPQFNKIVFNRIKEKSLETHYRQLFNIHNKKIMNAYSTQNKFDLKGQQLQQQKKTSIDKSNIILFEKMTKIMKRNDPLNQGNHKVKTTSRKLISHIQRVNQENQQFLQRLCNLKPTINNKKIFQERQKQLVILKSLGRTSCRSRNEGKQKSNQLTKKIKSVRSGAESFDSKIKGNIEKTYSVNRFSQNFKLQLNIRPRYTEPDEPHEHMRQSQDYFKKQLGRIEQRRRKVQSSMDYSNQAKMYKSQSSQRIDFFPLKMKAESLMSKNIILYTSFKNINGCMYKIFLIRKHNCYQIICAQVNNLHKKLYLQLDQTNGNEIFKSIDQDYQLFISSLIIKNQSLQIDMENIINFNKDKNVRLKRFNASITEQPNQCESTINIENHLSQIT